jgi:ribulose-phosphate 3-epimerase
MEYQLAGSPQQDFSRASTLVVDPPQEDSRLRRYRALRAQAPVVVPALLLCDFGRLADEVRRLEDAAAPAIHLDVMDGHFVPNITYGLPIVRAVRQATRLPIETHLMISNPAQFAEQFVEAGADVVTFHREAVDDPRPLLQKVRSLGAVAVLAYSPHTSVAAIRDYLGLCDGVLTMSVTPGFGNQHFESVALAKLRELAALAGDRLTLEVDGGVNAKTIAECAAAGSHWHVVGSAIFQSPNYSQTIAELTRLAKSAPRTQ